MRKIQHFVKSRQVYDQIFSIIDKNNDMLISKHEWITFFDNFNIVTEDSNESKLYPNPEMCRNNFINAIL